MHRLYIRAVKGCNFFFKVKTSSHDAAASVEQGFNELFAPPSAEDGDFFLTDDQFFVDDVTMSSDATNRAFIAALRDFSQRDELSGLQSLCARFRS
jgi:hypothetical protein